MPIIQVNPPQRILPKYGSNLPYKNANPPRSRSEHYETIPINLHLWSDNAEIDAAIASFIESFCKPLVPENFFQSKYFNTVKILVLNLYMAQIHGRNYWVSFSLNKNVLDVPKRYRKSGISYKKVKFVIDALKKRQLIEFELGYYDRSKFRNTLYNKSKRSRMKPAAIGYLLKEIASLQLKFIRNPHQELIELKNCDKKLINYTSTVAVNNIRNILNDYNKLIEDTKIEFPNSQSSFVDFSDLRVKRVFNNSSWQHGGRFYGGWWLSIKRKSRKNITINNNRTIEMDYKSLHPFMLYSRVGADLNFDPYELPEYHNYPERRKVRNLVKQLILISLNASNITKALKAMNKKITKNREDYPEVIPELKELLDQAKRHNSPIETYFCTGVGIELQYKDSQIAEYIIRRMTSEGKLVLCYHDGFRCEAAYENQLRQLMTEGYLHIMRSDSSPVISMVN